MDILDGVICTSIYKYMYIDILRYFPGLTHNQSIRLQGNSTTRCYLSRSSKQALIRIPVVTFQ